MATLSGDTQLKAENEEVEPPCKKRSLQDQIHFVHLKLHTRLIIYDYLNINVNEADGLVYYDFDNSVAYSSPHSYARMTVAASVLGDLKALQYLAGSPENIFLPKNYKGLLFNMTSGGSQLLGKGFFNMACVCGLLAKYGHWKALKWAISQKYPHKYCTLTGAAEGGASIEILQWLSSQGCLGDESTFTCATERGDWNIMKWLRQIGCPWDSETFSAAVRNEKFDLEVLKWLKINKCPWAPKNDTLYAFMAYNFQCGRSTRGFQDFTLVTNGRVSMEHGDFQLCNKRRL
jgi:hypothetical protein